MPATDDRWDVTVVGLRDPSHANAVMVVAELAHYASIPPHDVERMLLEEGELPVLANLDRAEAERAAHELNELGAVVDLRLADATQGVYPVLKPDAERQVGTAVGGLIDDSATPPRMGETFGGLPQVEPDLEAPQPSRRRKAERDRPAHVMGAGDDLLGFMSEGTARHDDLVSRGPPGLDDEPIPERLPIVRQPSAFSPRRKEKPKDKPDKAKGQASPGQAAQAQGGQRKPKGGQRKPKGGQRKPGAKQGQGSMEDMLGDIGPASGSPEDLLGDVGPGGGAVATESPKLPSRLERATKSAAAQTSGPLELDFEAAGMKRPPPKGGPSAAPPMHQAERSANSMPRRTRAGNMGGTGASAGGYRPGGGGFIDSIREDGVAGVMLGLCVGLILSLIVALALQRSDVREKLPPLEEELTAALSDPMGVESGDVRAPSKVEGDLDTTLGGIERKFFMVWLGAGLPIGFLLSRLRAL